MIAAAGGVVGGIVGFAIAANTSREIINHFLAGAGVGGVLGALLAFVIAGVDAVA